MRIAVTGASGNLGTAVLRRLQDGTNHDIIGIVRRRPPDVPPYAGVAWHIVDLAAADAAERLRLPFTRADAVVHLAWGFQPTHRREYLRATGVGGTHAVLRAAAECHVPHLVHMSSSAVYSPGGYGCRVDESWPAHGVEASAYSQDKVSAERTVRSHVSSGSTPSVTILRPGLIGQYEAGNQLLRYVLPDWIPDRALHLLPLVPIDESLCVPAVHADDVADAVARAVGERRSRAYNLAAETPASSKDILEILRSTGIDFRASTLRALAHTTWRLHIQPVDGGWIDLAYSTPLLNCTRVHDELGWSARTDGPDVVRELVEGMLDRAGTASPVLETRSFVERLSMAVRRGGVAARKPP